MKRLANNDALCSFSKHCFTGIFLSSDPIKTENKQTRIVFSCLTKYLLYVSRRSELIKLQNSDLDYQPEEKKWKENKSILIY